MKGVFDKVKINVMGIYIGTVFTVIGIGIILLQKGTASTFIETVKSMGFWIAIPIIFIIVGILEVIKCVVDSRNNTEEN